MKLLGYPLRVLLLVGGWAFAVGFVLCMAYAEAREDIDDEFTPTQ